MSREDIVQQILSLSPEDRLYILQTVKATQPLPFDGFASEAIQNEVLAELEDRIAASERGEIKSEDWQVVMARVEASLDEIHAHKVTP